MTHKIYSQHYIQWECVCVCVCILHQKRCTRIFITEYSQQPSPPPPKKKLFNCLSAAEWIDCVVFISGASHSSKAEQTIWSSSWVSFQWASLLSSRNCSLFQGTILCIQRSDLFQELITVGEKPRTACVMTFQRNRTSTSNLLIYLPTYWEKERRDFK